MTTYIITGTFNSVTEMVEHLESEDHPVTVMGNPNIEAATAITNQLRILGPGTAWDDRAYDITKEAVAAALTRTQPETDPGRTDSKESRPTSPQVSDGFEYIICQRRGHEPSLAGWSDNFHTWSVCKWCGIDYRTETTVEVIERITPPGATDDVGLGGERMDYGPQEA